jgi:hypothetical protein
MAENGKTDSTNEEDKPGVPDEGTLADLDAAEWADVLADHSELAGKCDWTKFSLLEVAGILARQPAAAEAAKKSRGIRGGILAIAVEIDRALNDSMEFCRKALKPGEVPRHPRTDGTRNAPMWVPYSVAEPGMVTLSAALDGKTVFSRNLDLSRPDGLAVEDRGTLFEADAPAEGRQFVGCAPNGPSGWSAWVMEVPPGFRFDPGKLVVPFHRSRIEADGPVLRLIRPPEFRYGRRKPGGDSFRFLTRSWLVRMFGPDRTQYWIVENGSVTPYDGPWLGLPDSVDDGGSDGGKGQKAGPRQLSPEEFFR